MKGLSKGVLGLIAVAVVIVIWAVGKYNGMVSLDQDVKTAWGNVQNDYQRRADLIPNLVETVKGYAAHETEVFQAVSDARAKLGSTNINVDNLSEEELAKYNQAQSELGSALGRLIAVSEAYPELKSNENFRDLQAQLEGTENRIKTSRDRFNEKAREYNVYIKKFPANICAGIFGFKERAYFEAEAGAEHAPKVKF